MGFNSSTLLGQIPIVHLLSILQNLVGPSGLPWFPLPFCVPVGLYSYYSPCYGLVGPQGGAGTKMSHLFSYLGVRAWVWQYLVL
jgi:hypothetical protein